MRPIGPPVSMAGSSNSEACAFLFKCVHEIENIPRVFLGMVAERSLASFAIGSVPASTRQKRRGIQKGRPFTFERARILSLRKEGMDATEIAKAVGCKRGNDYKTLKAAGVELK